MDVARTLLGRSRDWTQGRHPQNASMSEAVGRSRMMPALPCLLGFVLGLACNWVWPWPLGPYEYVLPAGALLAVVVVVLVVNLLRAFSRHDTSPDPKEESTAIVDTGPFRFSRNPAYVAAGLLQAVLGLLFNNVWILLTIIPAMIVIHYVVVIREEAYLEEKFGEAYLDYKSQVRRWI
ncbi:MAG: isoprenylcysteine carboxylmethyltransferase family protein [Gemmatimonadetes bacterium]|nr:isoprenylcysteine carboxylmethyltransferase family protein [Gemmatimonadota bacterium]